MKHTNNNNHGDYTDFLTAIRTFECSIDPLQSDYYDQHYDDDKAVTYQQVEYPGRVIRDKNGIPKVSTTSVKGYFTKLGVDKFYTRGSSDPKMFRTMQYAVMNYLGFVGYQFSEHDLWDLGYYSHYDSNGLPMYYSDVDVSNWSNGVRDKIMVFPEGKIHVTDVNTWQGTFTGKHDINSFDDVINPDKQEFIALDHFDNKYQNIVLQLSVLGKKLDDYLGTTLRWSTCEPPLTPPGSRPDSVEITLSGLLAGAHLRGAEGVVALLVNHENHADENGTAILQYVYDFGGYTTPYGKSVAA
ncbi:hypothetical protein [Serratia quinivorans]|uniref:hypothetical protein n=1 Tax=Serratia quinivorans TaxID=137545 RepID=UPI00217BDC35|nr:hypothetical protein [Serratia quinivorans]CAI1025224.1 Uncharacterised protein [Serratia quinivorans]CAI2127378.1 Uncharacterised protein [Serratia quinivorans]